MEVPVTVTWAVHVCCMTSKIKKIPPKQWGYPLWLNAQSMYVMYTFYEIRLRKKNSSKFSKICHGITEVQLYMYGIQCHLTVFGYHSGLVTTGDKPNCDSPVLNNFLVD